MQKAVFLSTYIRLKTYCLEVIEVKMKPTTPAINLLKSANQIK